LNTLVYLSALIVLRSVDNLSLKWIALHKKRMPESGTYFPVAENTRYIKCCLSDLCLANFRDVVLPFTSRSTSTAVDANSVTSSPASAACGRTHWPRIPWRPHRTRL